MNANIYVGSDKESIQEVLNGVLAILNARDPEYDDSQVIIKALEVFGQGVSENTVSIHDCSFGFRPNKRKKVRDV